MNSLKLKKTIIFLMLTLFVGGCNGKLPGGDARKFPADPKKRVEQNLAQGKGFRLNDVMKPQGGVFDFANSNELWRASLDSIDFIPLASANYSGGIIITDWYSNNTNSNESIKIIIRFLTNEIRSDAIDIKIYKKKCVDNLLNCNVIESDGVLVSELRKKILKTAAILKEENNGKNQK